MTGKCEDVRARNNSKEQGACSLQNTPVKQHSETPPPSPLISRSRGTSQRTNSKRRRHEKSTDRYIPNRSSTDVDMIHHLMTSKKSKLSSSSSAETPSKKSSKLVGRCLFSAENAKKACTKLLSFTAKRKLDFSMSECLLPRGLKTQLKLKEETALKILNAPGAAKNFYYNLVDWGVNNIVVIGLKEDVYYWDAAKSQAYVLPQEAGRDGDLVTCVRWKPDATKHIVASRYGTTKLWDSTVCKLVSSHVSPTVYSASWRDNNLVSLGRGDGTVLHWDVRTPDTLHRPFSATSGIICGVDWDREGESLAVGCNDNKVQIFRNTNLRESETLTMVYQSAVKAISWNPLQRGVLATGSGQNDQRVVVWDLISGNYKNCIDTKSQVTGLIWSPSCNQLVTSHGHFDPNLRLWELKNSTNTCKLTGHTNMIVSIAKSPLNDHIISLSADESLRVWNIFAKNNASNKSKLSSSALSLDKIR